MRVRMLRTGATTLALALFIGGCTGTATTPSWTMAPESPQTASTAPSPTPTPPASSNATTATTTIVQCDCPCASASTVAYPGLPVAKVTLHGRFFTRAYDAPDIRRGKGLVVAPETLTDGRFLDRFQQWDEGAVWWEETPPELATPGAGAVAERPWIELALDGTHAIDSAIVQADNNDTYLLSYRDTATGDWKELWQVPPDYSFGMVTRPNQMDDTARMTFGRSVTTDALRLEALEGDAMYAISEVQFFGT